MRVGNFSKMQYTIPYQERLLAAATFAEVRHNVFKEHGRCCPSIWCKKGTGKRVGEKNDVLYQ